MLYNVAAVVVALNDRNGDVMMENGPPFCTSSIPTTLPIKAGR
jgi:hypothetical protein